MARGKQSAFAAAMLLLISIAAPALGQLEVGRDITKYKIPDITPGSEVVTLVANGGGESRGTESPAGSGRYPSPLSWSGVWGGFSVEPAPPGVSTPGFLGNYHWLVHAEDSSAAGAAVSYLTLQPTTDYVLSAYLWNWGDSGHRVQCVIDAYQVSPEACRAKAQCFWDLPNAGEGYFVHATFTTGSSTSYFARVQFWREAGGATGWPMQPYACMYDNLAVTRLSDFIAPRLYVPHAEVVVDLLGGRTNLAIEHLFYPGDNVTISAQLSAPETYVTNALFEYQIVDFFGNLVGQGSADLKVNPNTQINYQPSSRGVFYLNYTIKDGAELVQSGKLSFSVVPAAGSQGAPPADAPFGVCFGIPSAMGVAGMKWNRSDFCWPDIEPQRGTYYFTGPDQLAANASLYNYQLMPILDYTATWASTAPPGTPEAEKRYYPPVLADWSNYVGVMVSRYKDWGVKYWEIWNEPDTYYTLFRGTPEQYADVLRTAYLAAKQADPTCKVVGCGGVNSRSIGFLKRVFAAGGAAYLDILSVHPYRPAMGSPEETGYLAEMAALRGLLDQYGRTDVPIWHTEFQWPADDLDPSSTQLVGEGTIVTEKQQADYLARFYVQGLSTGYVKNHFWFTMKHPITSLAESPDSGAGLLRQDDTAKPAFVAHRTLTDLLSAAAPIGSTDLGTLKAYRFSGNPEVMAVWDTNGPQIAAFDVPAGTLDLVDLMGNQQTISATGGHYRLPVGETPVFLKGNGIGLVGGVISVDWGGDYTMNIWDVRYVTVHLSNPTEQILSGTLEMASPEFASDRNNVGVSLAQGESTDIGFLIWVTAPAAEGKTNLMLTLSLNAPFSTQIARHKELMLVPWNRVTFDEGFEETLSGWSTNASEAHVEYNTVAKSPEYAHTGQYSLKWRCKSTLWNNVIKSFPAGIDTASKAIEFWVYLRTPAVGSGNLSLEFFESGGAKYGIWEQEELMLPEPGKWKRYVVPFSDLQLALGSTDPDGALTPGAPFYLYFNYTNGELELYIDDVRCLAPAASGSETGADIRKLRLGTVVPGTEEATLVANGGFESRGTASGGRYPNPPSWTTEHYGGMDIGPAPAGVTTSVNLGSYHALSHMEDGLSAGAFAQTVTLLPYTDYVLSGYFWNWGNTSRHARDIIGVFGQFPDGYLCKTQVYWDMLDAGGGYFVCGGFTTDSRTQYIVRTLYERETSGATGWPMQPYGGMWDNIAVTRASDFRLPLLLESTTVVGGIEGAKLLPDGALVSISGKVAVSSESDFSGFFYIEEQDRSSGVRVTATSGSSGLLRGSVVDIIGTMNTTASGEREVANAVVTLHAQ